MVAVFAFTWGVHLGEKRSATQAKSPAQVGETTPVATVNDQLPDARELPHEQAKGVDQAADESLSQSLKDEVTQVGAKTEKTVQVDLPKKPQDRQRGRYDSFRILRSSASGSTTRPPRRFRRSLTKRMPLQPVPHQRQLGGRFSLQIGSYPALADAKARIDEVSKTGLKPFLKEAEVQGRGRWYRVYVGEFSTKSAADKAGQKFRLEHLIDSFIVAKVGDSRHD